MKLEAKLLVYLLTLAVVDLVIPIPITAGLLIYALIAKPTWFLNVTQQVYGMGSS